MNKLHVVPNQINTGQSTSIQKRERNCLFPSRESVVTETVQCRTRTPLGPPRLPPLTGGSLLVNGGGPRNASRAPVRQQSKHAGHKTHTRGCPALRAAETPTPETALNSRNLLQPVLSRPHSVKLSKSQGLNCASVPRCGPTKS